MARIPRDDRDTEADVLAISAEANMVAAELLVRGDEQREFLALLARAQVDATLAVLARVLTFPGIAGGTQGEMDPPPEPEVDP